MSNSHDWLNLVEVSGPFLAVPVLRDVFRQGLEALPRGRPRRLRQAYDEWRDAVDENDIDLSELHAAWIDEVLNTALEIEETVLCRDAALPEGLKAVLPEHGVTVAPDLAVVSKTNADEPLLLIHVYQPDTDLDAKRTFDGLTIAPADRMVALLRATGCPIGIATNGERWMLVHAPAGAVTGFASWYARIWGQEPETLRAFVSLLGVRRLFGPDEGKLSALYDRSLEHQDDVTEALGEQVQRAVEVLIQALDRADEDRNRELLSGVEPSELYEAGLTVMMRLVLLLAAEERGLLLLGEDPRYDSHYAVSSLRMLLRAESKEILERRQSAWSRLLALFRGIHGGLDHPTLGYPALGGSIFDPDRYPFLEGRKKGTKWRTDPADPLPIDDRTVLLLLEAIQTFDGRTLSYRALDVEQIGYVYEGLLERTVRRVEDVTLELESSGKAKNPRVTFGEVESARLVGKPRLIKILKQRSGRSPSAVEKALKREVDDRLVGRLLTACRGDVELRDRIRPLAHLLRTDPWGYPLVHPRGAYVVVLGADRRESGTHYTPKNLTEKIVEETLTPIAYCGPAEGKARDDWELKSVEELLDLKICDPAMGSGAFLVQACRWLSDRLVEAWSTAEADGKRIDCGGRVVEKVTEDFDPLSQELEERAIVARRLVAERCLYGVDKNPLAVELTKLSLWLTTISKRRPFDFLDHNLRSGDSLLGIQEVRQLTERSLEPKDSGQSRLYDQRIREAVQEAIELRLKLRSVTARHIEDVNEMANFNRKSLKALELPELVADAFIGIILAEQHKAKQVDRLQELENYADQAMSGDAAAKDKMRIESLADLRMDAPDETSRRPFHWPLAFPEVFISERCGFDAFIGNPPFTGGLRISSVAGPAYNVWLATSNSGSSRNADLAAHFFRRGWDMLGHGGGLGLLATNSIAEGDTRQSGLEWMVRDGATIYAAYPSEPWPGRAAVVTSRVHLRKGEWLGARRIFDDVVDEISPFLTAGAQWSPAPLKENAGLAYQGSTVFGMGFVLDKEIANRMLDTDPKYAEVIFPYLNGQDLNTHPLQEPSRFVINFWDWPEERAKEYELPFQWIMEHVYPEALKKSTKKSYKNMKWWQHLGPRPTLYHAIGRGHYFESHPAGWDPESPRPSRVLVVAGTSKTLAFSYVSADMIFSNTTNVFSTGCYSMFATLQSNIHAVFSWQHSSRMKNDLRYSPTNVLEPFPFPDVKDSDDLNALAIELDDLRRKIMIASDFGLTKLYNQMHLRETSAPENDRMRELHREIDRSLADAYGWDDLDLEHGFHEVAYLHEGGRTRFTISEAARAEVLRRLSELNKQRHDEEVENRKATKSSKSKRARPRSSLGQSELGLGSRSDKK